MKSRPKTLVEAKSLADSLIDTTDQEATLKLALGLLGLSKEGEDLVLAQWRANGMPAIQDFAPYFRYVFSVDLFFYLAMAADLISRDRPSHKVDIAYLYYLPFCMVFTSNDRLHATTVPLFLRPDQTFVNGAELKADLGKLDKHYSSLPEEVRNRGLFSFAAHPPGDAAFLVTQLWDKHLPAWRGLAESHKPLSTEAEQALLKLVKRFEEESTPIAPSAPLSPDQVHQMTIQRKVFARKGKWRRFSPEVERANLDK